MRKHKQIRKREITYEEEVPVEEKKRACSRVEERDRMFLFRRNGYEECLRELATSYSYR